MHIRKLLQVVSAILASLLTAGVIFGFAALKTVLVQEGVYSSLCDSDGDADHSRKTGRACTNQDLQLNLAFTISVVVNNVAALPIGITLDKIGPRKTSIIGCVLFLLGNLCMGLHVDSLGFEPFLPAYILLAVGGPMIFLSSFHLCNAFPEHSGLVLSAITGAFDASSLPFVVYAAIYRRYHVSLRTWFWLYTAIPLLVIIQQIFLAPSEPYLRANPDDSGEADERTALLGDNVQDAETEDLGGRPRLSTARASSAFESSFSRVYFEDGSSKTRQQQETLADQQEEGISVDPITGTLWGRSALAQIKTSWFWLPQLFLTCYMLRINYEIATVFDQVLYYTGELQLAEKLTDAFVLLLPLGGVISIPMIGYILDKRSSMAAFVALLLLGLLYGVLCMSRSAAAQVIGITLFALMRPLLYTAVSDYYSKVIGFETFGTVYGLANALSGLFTLVQYPIDYAVKKKLNGNYTPINAVLLSAGLLLSLLNIVKQYRHRKSISRTQESAIPEN